MRHDRVTLEIADGIAELQLNRPEAGNALDKAMAQAIDEAIRAVEDSDAARVLLITAQGRSFCVGGDLRHLQQHLDRLPDEVGAMIGIWHESTLPRLAALPIPVVTAAQGATVGRAVPLRGVPQLRSVGAAAAWPGARRTDSVGW